MLRCVWLAALVKLLMALRVHDPEVCCHVVGDVFIDVMKVALILTTTESFDQDLTTDARPRSWTIRRDEHPSCAGRAATALFTPLHVDTYAPYTPHQSWSGSHGEPYFFASARSRWHSEHFSLTPSYPAS